MQNIPDPETLLGETTVTIPETEEFSSLVASLTKALEDNRDHIKRGQTLRVMVSCETSRDDIEAVCRLCWSRGWLTAYISCPPRPHHVFFGRPQFYGMPNRSGVGSIH